jgi:hypothetical protein
LGGGHAGCAPFALSLSKGFDRLSPNVVGPSPNVVGLSPFGVGPSPFGPTQLPATARPASTGMSAARYSPVPCRSVVMSLGDT